MLTVKTNTNKMISADLVLYSKQYNIIHIYTKYISPVEAYQIFGDENETKVLRVLEEGKKTKVYRNFTDIYSVQKSSWYPDEHEILIWLQKVEEEEEEEEEPEVQEVS